MLTYAPVGLGFISAGICLAALLVSGKGASDRVVLLVWLGLLCGLGSAILVLIWDFVLVGKDIQSVVDCAVGWLVGIGAMTVIDAVLSGCALVRSFLRDR